jgi:hypothetical protein
LVTFSGKTTVFKVFHVCIKKEIEFCDGNKYFWLPMLNEKFCFAPVFSVRIWFAKSSRNLFYLAELTGASLEALRGCLV